MSKEVANEGTGLSGVPREWVSWGEGLRLNPDHWRKWKCWSLIHFQLCNPVDCGPPGSSVRGILQASVLEWVALLFSRGSSRPRDWTQGSNRGLLPCWQILYHLSRQGSPNPDHYQHLRNRLQKKSLKKSLRSNSQGERGEKNREIHDETWKPMEENCFHSAILSW